MIGLHPNFVINLRRCITNSLEWVHCNFEANQNINAFWEWGIGNGELQRKSFCKDSMLPLELRLFGT